MDTFPNITSCFLNTCFIIFIILFICFVQFFIWLHNMSKEIRRSELMVGENLREAEALEAVLREQENEVKVGYIICLWLFW